MGGDSGTRLSKRPRIVGNGSDSCTSCYSDSDSAWASGVLSAFYWSSTTVSAFTSFAWGPGLDLGVAGSGAKSGFNYVWPVRGGQ
jgi:hypothetical protein